MTFIIGSPAKSFSSSLHWYRLTTTSPNLLHFDLICCFSVLPENLQWMIATSIILQDEKFLIWYSGQREKQLRLSSVTKIVTGQRTVCNKCGCLMWILLVKLYHSDALLIYMMVKLPFADKFSEATSTRQGAAVLFTYLCKWWTLTWSGNKTRWSICTS